MNIIVLLEILKYMVFGIFLFAGTIVLYRTITPKELRETHRLRFKEKLFYSAKSTEKKLQNKSFDEKLKEAGLSYLNSFRYEIIRLIIVLLFIVNYLILPAVRGEGLTAVSLSILLLIWLLTEHRFQIPVSLINPALNLLISNKQKKRSIELFTLYDVLKSDLQALHDNQSVNVYNLMKDSLPMYRHIDGTVSRFLSTFLTNPKAAEKVFYEDIKTLGAKTLGEIIIKIDNLSRDEALEIIQTESNSYAQHFFKEEFREGQKRKNRLQTLFSINVLFNAAWLIIFITSMLLIQIGSVSDIM
ncbi:hypothetical protein [Oceanobacillus luteolus]|uniref:Type II secretion system protein GspF domain-containing protein n=1 Tax=Oceanobacillus luteolus TaxID=1274358 RepID=A0ABW4HW68_9BACI